MRRRLFALLAVISAIGCAAIFGLAVRSFWVCEEFGRLGLNQYGITSNRGVMRFYRDARFEDVRSADNGTWTTRQDPASDPPRFVHHHRAAQDIGDSLFVEFGAVSHYRRTGLWVSDMVVLTVPHWFIAGLLAILPTWTFLIRRRRWIEQARRERNQCRACGYDLRATPDRCPECGTSTLRQLLFPSHSSIPLDDKPAPRGYLATHAFEGTAAPRAGAVADPGGRAEEPRRRAGCAAVSDEAG